MAHDDMHVLMYKVLAYLYRCMKEGVAPDAERVSCGGELFQGIPHAYWIQVMRELVDKKLVRGIAVFYSDDAPSVIIRDPSVTLEGVEFMQENTMMRKAARFLKEAKGAIPFV